MWMHTILAFLLVAISCSPISSERVHYAPLPPGTPGTAWTTEELFTGSDVVVIGAVVETRTGRQVGPPGEPGVQFQETIIKVDEIIAGKVVDGATLGPGLLVVETETKGRPFVTEWRRPGTQVVVFLWLKRDAESGGRYYRLLTMEGVFIVEGQRLSGVNTGAISAGVEASSLDTLRQAIRTARTQNPGNGD